MSTSMESWVSQNYFPFYLVFTTPCNATPCICANLLAGFLARDLNGRAIVGGTPEFPGQLIALLLVAHWLERWCASLAAQVQFLACPVQRQLLQGGTWSCCCHPPCIRVLHEQYSLNSICLLPVVMVKVSNTGNFHSIFKNKFDKANVTMNWARLWHQMAVSWISNSKTFYLGSN